MPKQLTPEQISQIIAGPVKQSHAEIQAIHRERQPRVQSFFDNLGLGDILIFDSTRTIFNTAELDKRLRDEDKV